MNSSSFRRATRPLPSVALLAATVLFGAGCSKDNFAKVNGQVISKDEYIQALERAQVVVPGAQQPGASSPQTINAGRYVLDQMVGKKVVQAQAAKMGVMPTDADVQKAFEAQKRLFQQQNPGKSFEDAWMKEQGMSEAQIKEDMRSQMTETNLLAKEMNITEDELKKAYEQYKSQLGLPERAQLRMIVAAAGSKEFSQAQKMLSAKTDFTEVARQVNPPAFKSTGGLMPQAVATTGPGLPPAWTAKIKQTAEGGHFGPVDWPAAPGQKAWIKVEKKFPAFTLPYEDAKVYLKQQMVRARLADPKNARVRQNIMDMKLQAKFESSDPKYQTMWSAVKEAARNAGMAQEPTAAAPVTAMPAPGG